MPFQPATPASAHKCESCLGPIRPDAAAYMLRPSRDAYFRQQRFHEQCVGSLRPEFRSQLVRYRTKRPLRGARPSTRLKAGRRREQQVLMIPEGCEVSVEALVNGLTIMRYSGPVAPILFR